MGYDAGWAAVNLDMPPRVPRTELSADSYHWDLVNAVVGSRLTVDSPAPDKLAARQVFVRDWDYSLMLGSAVGANVLEKRLTRMGHASFAQQGRDYDDRVDCPFKTPEEVLAFDPWEVYGPVEEAVALDLLNTQYRRTCGNFPDQVNMTGVYVSLMTGMTYIFGWDMLLTAAGTDPAGFGEVVNRYATWIQQYYNACATCESAVIYCHDDMVWTEGPFIHPDWYRRYIFPNLKKLWAPLRAAGKKIVFVCDGNYTPFVDDIAACGNHGFWFEVFTDLKRVTERYGRTHFIIGNGDCRVLTFGTKPEIRAEVERCMAAGKRCPGYIMCISGHIPPNVPVENALYYNEVYNELARR
ncbi:MAG: hypothetical protein K8T26_14070 [Lentisphaerae bacterium]|nr:hypothetical protein [Lentisphaerota bacterium]